jgi:hypothetical protein
MKSLFEVLYPFLVMAEFSPTFWVRISIWSIWLAANIHTTKRHNPAAATADNAAAAAAAAEPLVHTTIRWA